MTPDEFTIKEHTLETADGLHSLYIQEWGQPDGVPILYLHGGPGGLCNDGHKQNFNPLKHRVIFFDQRGAGRSTPYGSLEENNTQKLIDDIELIREKLEIEKLVLMGRSWGSTLALCYAIAHPEAVQAIVTGGIYLGTKAEHEYVHKGGFQHVYPEAWQKFLDKTPGHYRENPGAYHTNRVVNGTDTEASESALVYSELISSLISIDDRIKPVNPETFDTIPIKIEVHYKSRNDFIEDNHILNNADSIKAPVYIVHGRYDLLCPPVNAYNLYNALPNSSLTWTQAGHKGSDRANYEVTKAILEQFS